MENERDQVGNVSAILDVYPADKPVFYNFEIDAPKFVSHIFDNLKLFTIKIIHEIKRRTLDAQ